MAKIGLVVHFLHQFVERLVKLFVGSVGYFQLIFTGPKQGATVRLQVKLFDRLDDLFEGWPRFL